MYPQKYKKCRSYEEKTILKWEYIKNELLMSISHRTR